MQAAHGYQGWVVPEIGGLGRVAIVPAPSVLEIVIMKT